LVARSKSYGPISPFLVWWVEPPLPNFFFNLFLIDNNLIYMDPFHLNLFMWKLWTIFRQLEHLFKKITYSIHFIFLWTQFSQFKKKEKSFTRLRSLARTISLLRLVCFNSILEQSMIYFFLQFWINFCLIIFQWVKIKCVILDSQLNSLT